MQVAIAERIVSLVPSATETLVAWRCPPVGRTRFCPEIEAEVVGGTKNPDINAIVALEPDLVVVEREENRKEDYDALLTAGLDVLALSIRSLGDVNTEMERLGARVGYSWQAIDIPPVMTSAARAFVPIWRRPWMALGQPTYGASLLAALGVTTIPEMLGPYPAAGLDEIDRLSPDVVLAPTEPYPHWERHLEELESIAPTRIIDGQDLFWWGARTSAAISRIRSSLEAVLERRS